MSDNLAIQLPPNELAEAMVGAIRANRPVFIHSSPGLGKSSIARQVASRLNFTYFHDYRLSQMEPSEISMMVPDLKTGSVRQLPPNFWHEDTQHPELQKLSKNELLDYHARVTDNPSERPKSAFVFFDELNSAVPLMQAAAYQIILDRRIGEYSLGPLDYVMAAGNKVTDRGVVFQMPTPLANRFVHLELIPHVNQWVENMFEIPDYSLHPWVLSFLRFQNDELFRFDPKSGQTAFATPRTWEFVSDLVKANWGKLSNRTLLALIAGSVGEGPARKFLAFAEDSSNLPPVNDVLSGKIRKVDFRGSPSLAYSFTISLCYAFREEVLEYNRNPTEEGLDTIYEHLDNIFTFGMENLQDEMTIMMARKVITDVTQNNIQLRKDKIKTFAKFIERYGAISRKAALL